MVKKVNNVRVKKLLWVEQKSLERAVELRREIRAALIVLIQNPETIMNKAMNMIKKLERQIGAMEYELNCRKKERRTRK